MLVCLGSCLGCRAHSMPKSTYLHPDLYAAFLRKELQSVEVRVPHSFTLLLHSTGLKPPLTHILLNIRLNSPCWSALVQKECKREVWSFSHVRPIAQSCEAVRSMIEY